MENKEKDPALEAPAEANQHMNYLKAEAKDINANKNKEESIEDRRKKYDADSGNDSFLNEMLEKEIRIDPGNEHHHHRTDADDKIFDDDIDRSPRFEEEG